MRNHPRTPQEFLESIRVALSSARASKKRDLRTKDQKIDFIHETLANVEYDHLSRSDKGLVRQYVQRESGYSRAQVARVIAAFRSQPEADEKPVTVSAVATLPEQTSMLTELGMIADANVRTVRSMKRRYWVVGVMCMLCVALLSYANRPTASLVFLTGEREPVSSWQTALKIGSPGAIVETPTDTLYTVVSKTAATSPTIDKRRIDRLEKLFGKAEEVRRLTEIAPPSAPQSVLVASLRGLLGLPAGGKEGQVLIYSNGKASWRYLPNVTKLDGSGKTTGSGSDIPSRRGGGGSGGGGGGGSTSTTTIIQNITSGSTGPFSINDDTTGVLRIDRGGTGFGSFATGDLLVGSGGTLVKLSMGANGTVLSSTGGTLQWVTSSAVAAPGWTDDGAFVRLSTAGDSVGIGTATPKTKLEVIGTISGSSLQAATSILSSGSLTVNGAVTFKSLASCAILQTDSNGALSCGTVAASSNFGTGNMLTVGNRNYVNVSGDTMTGGLLLISGGHGVLPSADAGVLLEIAGTASGRVFRAQDRLASSGSLAVYGHAYIGNSAHLNDGSVIYDPADITFQNVLNVQERVTDLASSHPYPVFDGITNYLMLDPAGSVDRYVFGVDTEVNTEPTNAANYPYIGATTAYLEHRGLGTIDTALIADEYLNNRSSGNINTAYGNFIHVINGKGGTINEATGVYTYSAQNFGTGTINTGIGVRVGQPFNTQGTVLNNYGLYIDDQSSVGSVNSYNIYSLGASAKNYFAGLVGIGTPTPGSKLSVSGSIIVGGKIGSASADAGLALEILGTASGRILHAQDQLRSSGTLLVEGATTLQGSVTFSSLANCQILQTNSNGALSCGTVTASVSTGALATAFDRRYVNTSGDTMTGGLLIQNGGTPGTIDAGLLLEIVGTASGRILHAQDQLRSSGTLIVRGATTLESTLSVTGLTTLGGNLIVSGNVGIGTASPKTKLETIGTVSGTTLVVSNLANCNTNNTVKANAQGQLFCATDEGGGGSSSKWTDNGAITYLTQTSDDVAIGGSDATAPFYFSVAQQTLKVPTFSGSTLFANVRLATSGSLVVNSSVIFKSLTSCATLQTNSNGALSCGPAGLATSTGALQVAFDKRFVNSAGDTMTGGLLIVSGGNGTLPAIDTGLLLEIAGGMSGRTLFIANKLMMSGALVIRGASNTAPVLYTDLANGRVGIGTNAPVSALDIRGGLTLSGSTFATYISPNGSSIATKINIPNFNPGAFGQMLAMGIPASAPDTARVMVLNDARTSLHQPSILIASPDENQGIGFSFDGSNTLGLIKSSVDMGFAVGAFGAPTTAMVINTTGNVGIGTSSAETKLEVIGTASGRILHAQDQLRSSGSLLIEGASVLQGSVTLSALTNCQILQSDANGVLSCGTIGASSTFGTGNVLTIGNRNYVNTSGDTMTGGLLIQSGTLHGTLPTIDAGLLLEIAGTASGRILHAQDQLRSSGTLLVEGNSVLQGTVTFSALTNCNTLQTNSNGALSCNNAQYLATSTGSLQTAFDRRFVNTSGDTMTGGLLIQSGTLHGTLPTIDAGLLLEIAGTASGRVLHAQDLLTSSGGLKIAGHAAIGSQSAINNGSIFYPTNSFTNLLSLQESFTDLSSDYVNGITNYLELNPSTAPNAYVYGADTELNIKQGNTQNFSLVEGMFTSVNHYGKGTVTNFNGIESIAINHNSGTITNAKGLYALVENLGSGTIIDSYGLDLYSAYNTSNGTITNGYGLYIDNPVNSGGGTVSNNYGIYINDQSPVGSVNSYNLYSDGATAKNYFAGLVGIGKLGTPHTKLEVVGSMSGSSLTVSSLSNCQLIQTSSAGELSCGTDRVGASTGSLVTAFDRRYVNASGDTMTGGLLIQNGGVAGSIDAGLLLEVVGTASGRILHAQDQLRSSGSLLVEGASVLQGTVTFTSLTNCQVLQTNSNGALSCGTVAAATNFGTGNVLTIGDRNYVNVSGDTMTGGLLIQSGTLHGTLPTIDAGVLLEIAGTMSGRTLRISDKLMSSGALVIRGASNAQPVLYTDLSNGRIGIGTATPKTTLDVVGDISASGAIRDAIGWIQNQGGVERLKFGTNNGSFGGGATAGSVMSGSQFSFFDTTTVNANSKGFWGSVFDGRYIYLVPYSVGAGANGQITRYDTTKPLTSASSYTVFDTTAVDSNSKGFQGAVFDGRYVYFVPFDNGSKSGQVTRYDTLASFTSTSSYAVFDTTAVNANSKGFAGGIYDGRYVYFIPQDRGVGTYFGQITRYDTSKPFTSASAYAVFDTTGVDSNSKGFQGAVFDGRYIYLVPYYNGSYSGQITRYDTSLSFTSASAYSVFDATAVHANAKGFFGAVYDGRYVYFVPNYNGTDYSGLVTRYDTAGGFTSTSSYSVFDTTTVNSGAKGFQGAVYDGRYVYFVPNYDGVDYSGLVVRYDSTQSFTSASAYSTVNATSFNANAKGFVGGIFDGHYVYMVPYNNGSQHGTFLRMQGWSGGADSATTATKLARTSDLYILSNGNVGVGTVTPGSKLAVSGALIVGTNIGSASADAGLALEIIGTASGRILHAQDQLRSSGTLLVEGATVLQGSVTFTALTNCQALQTSSAGALSCATIAGSVSTGALVTAFDKRYVNTSGDTMSGGLLIVSGGNGTLPSIDAGVLLEVAGTMSGRKLQVTDALASSGSLVVVGQSRFKSSINVTGTMSGTSLTISGTGSRPLLTTFNPRGTLILGATGGIMRTATGFFAPQLYLPGRLPTTYVGSGATGSAPSEVFVQGRYAYTLDGNQSMRIVDVSNPTSPSRILSSYSTLATPGSVVVQGRYAYISEFGQFEVVDVSNPVVPVRIGSVVIGIAVGNNTLAIQGKYAFVVATGSNTLTAIDISNPASPRIASIFSITGSPTSITVQGKYAYVMGGNSVDVFDISNPAALTRLGTVAVGGAAMAVQGKYAYVVNSSSTRLQTVDVSNPSSLKAMGTVTVGTTPADIVVQGRYAYVVNKGDGTIQVIDIANPSVPQSLGTISAPGAPQSIFVQGRYAYIVTNTNNSLNVFDLGGAYIQQMEVGGLEVADLSIRNALRALDADFRGGVSIQGGLSVQRASTFSTTDSGAYALTIISAPKQKATSSGALAISVYGSARSPHIVFGSGSTYDAALWRSGVNALYTNASFAVKGTLSGASLTVSTLQSCSSLQTDSAGALSCGSGGGNFGTGNVLTIGNRNYVNTSGDTMSGGLLIVSGGNGTLPSIDAGVLLEVAGTMSGRTLKISDRINSSGALVIKKYAGSATGNLLVIDSKGLVYDGTNKRIGIGTSAPVSALEVNGTIENGLVGWWPMDEGVGTYFADRSANAVSNSSGAFLVSNGWTTGKFGKGTQFNGSNYAVIKNSTVLSPSVMTVSFWLKTNSLGVDRPILSKGKAAASRSYWFYENSGIQFGMGATVSSQITPAMVTDNNWHHIVGTYDGTNLNIYLDGNVIGTPVAASFVPSTGDIGINAYSDGSFFANAKKLDDLRIYSRVLSNREIADLYRNNPLGIGGAISTTLVIESGASLKVSGTISGAALNVMGGSSYMLGNLMLGSSATAETTLEIAGTASGRILHAQDQLRSSGTLLVEGSTVLQGSVTFSALTNCQALQTSSAGALSCATIAGSVSTGALVTAFDKRYVNTSGDTMTGGLLIQNTTTHGTLPTIDAGVLLEVAGTASGKSLRFASGFFTATGASMVPLTVREAVSHTGNLTEWQASDGTVLLSVPALGSGNEGALLFYTAGVAQARIRYHSGYMDFVNAGQNAVYPVRMGGLGINVAPDGASGLLTIGKNTTDATAIFRAITSQTGNLTEWQNTSNAALTVVNTSGYLGIGTSSPTTPLHIPAKMPTAVLGTLNTTSAVAGVAIQGRYVYATRATVLQVIDVKDPSTPTIIASLSMGTAMREIAVQGNYAYIVDNSDGLHIVDISKPHAPKKVATLASATGLDLIVQGRYAYISVINTLRIVDIANPAAPVQVGSTTTNINSPVDLTVRGNYAYIANYSSNNILVFDVSNPTNPLNVGSVTLNQTRQVTAQGNYLYASSGGYLAVIDASNPVAPTVVGSVVLRAVGGFDGEFIAQGRYVYVTDDSSGLFYIVDVTTPSAPTKLGSLSFGSQMNAMAIQGRYAYVASPGSGFFNTLDLGGSYQQNIEAGLMEVGGLSVMNYLSAYDGDFKGGLQVGKGIDVHGQSAISNTGTGSSAYALSITSRSGGLLIATRGTQDAPHIRFGTGGIYDVSLFRPAAGLLATDATLGVGTGAGLIGKTTIYTDDAFNNPGLFIRSKETTAGQDLVRIISDVTSTGNKVFRIQADGSTFSDNAYTSTGADYAEWFYSDDTDLVPGEAVCIDVTKPNSVKRCTRDGDANIMGIVSTNPAFIGNGRGGVIDAAGLPLPGYVLVGLIGQVPARAVIDTQSGSAIRPGDQVTAASIPGFVRRANPGDSTVGVALEGLESGQGIINVLISRRNQSMTVEAVEQKVLDSIRDMQIEDEVNLMVSDALQHLNVTDDIRAQIQTELTALSLDQKIDSIVNAKLSQRLGTGSSVSSQSSAGNTQQTQFSATGSIHAGEIYGSTLSAEDTLQVGGDARIGGDLHLEGTLHLSNLFIGGLLHLDGGLEVAGEMKTDTLTVESGSVLKGPVQILQSATVEEGARVQFSSGSTLFAATGSTVDLSTLIVRNALTVLGDITIQGLATFLGDVEIQGQLTVSARQAGFAIIPHTGTSVTIPFDPPFSTLPAINATPNGRVGSEWWISASSATGFTIQIDKAASYDVKFSWFAVGVRNAETVAGSSSSLSSAPAGIPFPVDALGVPVSSSNVWNACIRNQTVLDENGQPLSCARYHNDHEWEQPDLHITFTWNTGVTPPMLTLPEGYTAVMQQEATSSSEASSSSSVTISSSSSSIASSESSSESSSSQSVISSSSSSAAASESSSSVSSQPASSSSSSQSSEAQEEVVPSFTPVQ